ncbi:hypothetical protein I553_3885 [Mycobacterium xenopi 4042]|uniref:Uncharacterized protein n=1 Tax=Mycobacterium xenopi 4042 TaxID=1299334 RepID=X8DDQ2_MYCXE|nr:hypothetical protein I553_3885 [Mycobacterium xenopi 4042]
MIYFADTFVKRLTGPKKSRSTSSPRRGIAAMVSASGQCRSTTPSSNGIGRHARPSGGRAPDREIRCRVCDQGFPCPKAVPPWLWRIVAIVFNPVAPS